MCHVIASIRKAADRGLPASGSRQARLGGLTRLAAGVRARGTLRRVRGGALLIACLGAAVAVSACGSSSPTSGPPATPVLLGVGDGTCADIHPNAGEQVRLLPAQSIRLHVAAAWPSADLVVKTENGAELEKVIPDDTQRQNALKAAGVAYWVPDEINPNISPAAWTVRVELPTSMRAGPLTLALTSRTPGGASSSPLFVTFVRDMNPQAPAWNRVQLDWRDRTGATGYLVWRKDPGANAFRLVTNLSAGTTSYTDTDTDKVTDETTYSYRVTATGCASAADADATTPPGPKSGVDTITLFRSASDNFEFTLPLPFFSPRWDAVITSVTNVARDVNGAGIRLGSVRHTDSNGVQTSENPSGGVCPVALGPGDSSASFDGKTVAGDWSVRAVCISNALLPDEIDLRVSWRAPA